MMSFLHASISSSFRSVVTPPTDPKLLISTSDELEANSYILTSGDAQSGTDNLLLSGT